jgi:hypothetical protein
MKVSQLRGAEDGEDIFIIGTGTSLQGFDFSRLKGRKTIALNDAIRSVPSPNYHLYTDALYRRYCTLSYGKETTVVCRGHSYNQQRRDHPNRKIYIFGAKDRPKLCKHDDLFVFATVASTGIHLAQRMGAGRIFLLGVDAYRLRDRRYWDGKYKSNKKVYKVIEDDNGRLTEKHHLRWVSSMNMLRDYFSEKGLYQEEFPGSGIFNLSKYSRIDTWKKMSICSVFQAGL